MYLIDKITFNTNEKYLELADNRVSLDKQSSDILQLLIETKSPVSKETLLIHIWQNRFVSDAAISSAIRRVRKALAEFDGEKEYIKTLSKVGYQINVVVKPKNSPDKTKKVLLTSHLNLKILVLISILLLSVAYWQYNLKTTLELPASYRQALHLLAQKNQKSLPQAITLLEKSIEEQPKLVVAYHALSQLYAYKMSRHLQLTDKQIITNAKYYIEKAKLLAPSHPDTFLSQAMLDYFYLKNKRGVEQYHQRVKQGLECDHKCNFFLAYTAPIFMQADQGVIYAERAYKAQPDHTTYVWERAWSLFMKGEFNSTIKRIEEAEKFVGRTSYLFRAMLAQAKNQPEKAINHWIKYFHSIKKISSNDMGKYNDLLLKTRHQVIAGLLLKQLNDIPIDQEVELLLLAGEKEEAINRILETHGLQEQTYLIAMHVSPVFTAYFTSEELELLSRHIWP